MANKGITGAWGEALAAEYLRKQGYTLIGRNYRSRFGEIDLIAENRDYLVFAEVKLRKSANYAEAREFVDRRKQERLRATAAIWLETHESRLQPRFDVIEIYAPDAEKTKNPTVNWLQNAFW